MRPLGSHTSLPDHGVELAPAVVSSPLCAELQAVVLDAFASGQRSTIREPWGRVHAPLPLVPAVSAALREALQAVGSSVCGAVGPDAQLVELSSITVFPGADHQPMHRDCAQPGLVTLFVNLGPTAARAGALQVYPRSHHTPGFSSGDARVVEAPPGSVTVMDGRTFHGGRGNTSPDRVRMVVYATFGAPQVRDAGYSLREPLRLAYQLRDFLPVALQPDDTVAVLGRLTLVTPHEEPDPDGGGQPVWILEEGRVVGEIELEPGGLDPRALLELPLDGVPLASLAGPLGVSVDEVVSVAQALVELGVLRRVAAR